VVGFGALKVRIESGSRTPAPRHVHTWVWWSILIRLLSAPEVSLSVAVLTQRSLVVIPSVCAALGSTAAL
jgi:hypothetical protein